MIPSVCANCAKSDNVVGQGTVLGCVCKATPWTLWKDPGDTCGLYVMDANPVYVVPDDAPVGQGEPIPGDIAEEDVQGTDNGERGD